MKNTLTGRAIVIGDTETFASGFYKRQLVIETDGKYPQTVPITFAKESADKMAEKVSLGDPVEVDIRHPRAGIQRQILRRDCRVEGDRCWMTTSPSNAARIHPPASTSPPGLLPIRGTKARGTIYRFRRTSPQRHRLPK
jgi:hypothetical protein